VGQVRAGRVGRRFGFSTRSPILRILARAFLVSIAVMLVSFSLMRLTPGDPVTALLGENATAESIAHFRELLGLNGTFPEQLAGYVAGLAHGDMGKSLVFGVSVTTLIGQALPATLSLMLVTITFTILISVPLAVYVALHPRGRAASVFLVGASFFVSTPAFFVGLLALLVFAVWLHIAPVAGLVGTLPGSITYLWLPSLVISAALVPILARVLTASVSTTLREEFVEVAIVRGVRGPRFAWKYLIRPSIAPTLSLLSYIVGALFASAVVVELVFNLPGVGTLLVNAVAGRDYPLVQGIVLISGVFVVIVSTIGDIIITRIDPRANM
jgi:peptide/nickel transport system permease protein